MMVVYGNYHGVTDFAKAKGEAIPSASQKEFTNTCNGCNEMDLFSLIRAPNPAKDHTDRPSGSSRGGKSLAAMQLSLNFNVFISEGIPDDVSDPDPLAFVGAPSHPPVDVAQSSQDVTVAKGPGSKNVSSPIEVLSPGSVYRPEWGVTNGSLLDTPAACQDLVDHVVPPGYFAELRHMPNDEFLQQYNVNLTRQVAMGSQLRLRFEQEAKLLKKSVAALQKQVSGEEKLMAAFEEFKRIERCADGRDHDCFIFGE
nr:hypothetical protein [Tanacetum cinerariifolium]